MVLPIQAHNLQLPPLGDVFKALDLESYLCEFEKRGWATSNLCLQDEKILPVIGRSMGLKQHENQRFTEGFLQLSCSGCIDVDGGHFHVSTQGGKGQAPTFEWQAKRKFPVNKSSLMDVIIRFVTILCPMHPADDASQVAEQIRGLKANQGPNPIKGNSSPATSRSSSCADITPEASFYSPTTAIEDKLSESSPIARRRLELGGQQSQYTSIGQLVHTVQPAGDCLGFVLRAILQQRAPTLRLSGLHMATWES